MNNFHNAIDFYRGQDPPHSPLVVEPLVRISRRRRAADSQGCDTRGEPVGGREARRSGRSGRVDDGFVSFY